MKRKLLFVLPSLELGGAERSLIGLLEALDPQKAEVSVFLYQHKGELLQYLPQTVRLLPEIPAYRAFTEPITQLLKDGKIHLAAARLFAKSIFSLYGFFKKNAVGTWTYMQFISALLQLFLPKIPGEYDFAAQYLGIADTVLHKTSARKKAAWNHTDYRTQNPNRSLDCRVYKNIDYIVSVSEDCTAAFCEVYPAFSPKAVTVENCLPIELIRQLAEFPALGMEKNKGETILLSVGRFCSAKNFESIPKICLELLRRGVSVQWYIIGYGDRKTQIQSAICAAHMENFVLLLGKKENPYPYMRACDIYVQPSVFEGKCVAVREAQLLGKPVVITDFPTAHSQLRNGIDGILAPMDIPGCANAIYSLIQNKAMQNKLKTTCFHTDYALHGEAERVLKLAEQEASHAENQYYRAGFQHGKIS